ncbi:MAG: beta-lactamase family protein [Candidatus Lambdaproteobacteria bacterium]|nr:beta-lactamase family protein [Candidatus Lambdaproteobacteria bacterium]
MAESVYQWHGDPGQAAMARAPLEAAAALLEEGWRVGRHPGAQLYVSRFGRPVVEFACGEAAPGVPLTPESLLPWFSASKPVTAMAIALLYDRGSIGLDDPVRAYLPGFGAGKEGCTIRHVLTHQGGFAGAVNHADQRPWAEIIAAICAWPAEYPPGSKAGYHSTSGWYILGEIVRVVDGRPVERFVTEELLEPLGMTSSFMGIPPGRIAGLERRMARVQAGRLFGGERPFVTEDFIALVNDPAEWSRVKPAGGMRGPARDLGRLYEMLLAGGRAGTRSLIDRRTVALFTACHRWGMPDLTLQNAPLAWGLGFGLHGNSDVSPSASRRVFNHSGLVSTVALGDPDRGLACVILTTGLLPPLANARRLREVSGRVIAACLPAATGG